MPRKEIYAVMKGKAKCKALKEIRRQIAETNDIPYAVSQCTYQGDCKGTCPKCEAELKYLERELAIRQSLGKAVAVTGISAGVCAALTGCTPEDLLHYIPGRNYGYEETAGDMPMPATQTPATTGSATNNASPDPASPDSAENMPTGEKYQKTSSEIPPQESEDDTIEGGLIVEPDTDDTTPLELEIDGDIAPLEQDNDPDTYATGEIYIEEDN